MKTIKSIVLVILVLLLGTSLVNTSFALSTEMQKAISTSKQVEAKKQSLKNALSVFEGKIFKLTSSSISKKNEAIYIKKYNDINSKVDNLLVTHNNSTSIYKGITIDLLNDLKEFFNNEILKLENSIEARKEANTGIKIVKTEAERDALASKIAKTEAVTYSPEDSYNNEQLLLDNGVGAKESKLVSFKTFLGDGFEFCANFPSEVYTNHALRNYSSNEDIVVAKAYNSFKNTYYKNYYTNRDAKENSARIQQCVKLMYNISKTHGISKTDIETVYEKYYGNYVQYTTPFYLEGVQPEDIEEYINNHHNG